MSPIFEERKFSLNRVLALSLLCIVTAVLSFFIVYNANWLMGDDAQFLQTTAVGKNLPLKNYIIPSIGRFFPLGLMDYNVLNFFPKGTKATSHYTLVALSFLVFSLVSYFFYKNLSFSVSKRIDYNQWMISFCVVFILARLFSVYLSLIFPERIITCLLAIFLLLYLKFNNTDKWLYGFMALLIAIYLTYCKEPIFGSLFILSLTNLIFNYKGLTRRNKIFYYLLIINCFVFSILYYFLVYKNITSFYTGGNRSLSEIDLFTRVFRNHKLLFIAFILALVRLFNIQIKKDKKHLFYDGLLFAGLSYTIAAIILGLTFSYYYFPAVIMCLPSLIYWSLKILNVRWVTLIMLFSAFYCTYIIIDDIKENQYGRISTYPRIASIAESVSEGYSLIWFQPILSKNDNFDESIREWRKSSLEAYLQYILKRAENVDFKVISEFADTYRYEKSIVLYPVENELNMDTKRDFEDNAELHGFILFEDVGGIKVYIN